MALKSWFLILILAALPAFAGSEQPFNPGDVVSTSCGFSALYRRGSVSPSWLGKVLSPPAPTTGPLTYSPALNRMILGAYTFAKRDADGHVRAPYATLETLDTDGRLAPLLTLPDYARVTALAGVGREILAVVVLSVPSIHIELWRIAATEGRAAEQIGLPLPPTGLPIYDITSIDLAGDGCTLAYAVPGEVIHRYDICARRPLDDAATRTASAVHFLPQGDLLVSESLVPGAKPWTRLARYDREGRLVSAAGFALRGSITAIALDPDGSTAWIVTNSSVFGCVVGGGELMAVNVSSGALIAGPWQFGGQGVAVAGEWRAADQPPARGRAVRQ